MNKLYNRINFKNYPSVDSPLNDENLNKIDYATDEIDNRVISLDTTKATKTEVATMIADVSFNETTGIFTFTRKNGSVFSIDTLLEKVIVNFDFDEEQQKLIIRMEDGTEKEIDLSKFVSIYNFSDSDTIAFKRTDDETYTAYLNDILPSYLTYRLDQNLEDGMIYSIILNEIPSGHNDDYVEISGHIVQTRTGYSVPCSEFSEKKAYNLQYDMYADAFIFVSQSDIDKITGITAEIKKGSITGDYLEPNYLADVRVASENARTSSNSASNYASQARSWATGDTNSAKYYYEKTKEIENSVSDDYLPKSNAVLESSLNTNGYDIILSATKALDANSSKFTVPAAGSITKDVFAGSITAVSNFKSFIGSVQATDAVFYNMISARHRNGGGDGASYGMYLRSALTNPDNLYWRQQMGGTWLPEKTILDSSNWSNHVTPVFASEKWYPVGDAVKIGDLGESGSLCIIGNNGTTGIKFFDQQNESNVGKISFNSLGFNVSRPLYVYDSLLCSRQGMFTTLENDSKANFSKLSLQLREYGQKGAAVQNNGAAPGIGFHWGNRFGKSLILDTKGVFHFLEQDGVTDATIIAANCPNTEVGSATRPVYLGENGVPISCDYSLGEFIAENDDIGEYARWTSDARKSASIFNDTDVRDVIFTLGYNNNDRYFMIGDDHAYGVHLIGTDGYGIHLNGDTIYPIQYSFYSADGKIYLGANGNRFKGLYATNGTIQTSDRTKKKDFSLLDGDLAKKFVMGLKPTAYKFIDGESGRTHWGLIAQDVEELMDYLGIDSKDFAGFIKSPKINKIQTKDETGKKIVLDEVVEGEYDYSLRYDEFISPMIRMEQSHEDELMKLKETVGKQQEEINFLRRSVAKIYDAFGMELP